MKVILFGGSFNPIHNGHLGLIKRLVKMKITDELWIIPCGKHAFDKKLESEKHRVEMLKLAVREMKRVRINYIELKSKDKNYTIDTIRKLKETYPRDHFFLALGADLIKCMDKWHKYEELLNEIDIFAFKRPDSISSTRVRDAISNRRSISEMVPKAVEEYIEKNGLYKNIK